jgi:hypothetical protein
VPNKKTHVQTNTTKDSVKEVALQALTFNQLWAAYPKIVFFNGYWHRDSDGPNVTTGNHIDLWNGSPLTMAGITDTLATVGRFVFGQHSFLAGTDFGYSDLHNSSSILFWEVK